MDLCGQANGKPPAWAWDYKNLAPRLSMAWSPGYKDGLLGSIFGGPGKNFGAVWSRYLLRSLRARCGDHDVRSARVLWLHFNATFPPGTVSLDNAPRYTGEHDLPASLLFPRANPGVPSHSAGRFLDLLGPRRQIEKRHIRTRLIFPLPANSRRVFTLEVAYVGRLGRRLLQEKDLAQPVNLFDPKNRRELFPGCHRAGQDLSERANLRINFQSFAT